MSVKSFISISNNNGDEGQLITKLGGDSTDEKYHEVTVSQWNTSVSLDSVKVTKNIYSPNSVKCLLKTKTVANNIADKMIDSLMDATISVWVEKDDEEYLAKDYVIHEVNPIVYGAETFADVEIVAYSPDKLLTYDKYSMAYTTKRLCTELVREQLTSTMKDAFGYEHFQMDTLHNTSCKVKDDVKEIIQPYLVQYNESFYDFLRRVTYRSGEYLYFEDGKLHIGLTDNYDETNSPVMAYTSKRSLGRHFVRSCRRNISSHKNNINEDNATQYADNAAFNLEYSSEDYATILEAKPFKQEWHKQPATWVGILVDTLNQANYMKMLTTFAKDGIDGSIGDRLATDSKNEALDKACSFSDEKSDDNGADRYDVAKNSKRYTPYMMHDFVDKLMANAYNEIREGEQATRSRMQHVVLDKSNYNHTTLCQIVKFDADGDKYVITGIQYEEDSKLDRYEVDVVPFEDNSGNVFPPAQDDIETVRSAGPQTAYVTAVDDNAGMGRVQVRFHWQTKDGDQTPLIRLSSQMASSDAGIQFMPNVDDEVIVNFTNGNVDLPYVAGAMFNKSHKSPENTRTIRSSHGHSIVFDDDGDDTAFTKSMFPIIGTAKGLGGFFTSLAGTDAKSRKKDLKEKKAAFKAQLKKVQAKAKSESGSNETANQHYVSKMDRLKFCKEFLVKVPECYVPDKIYTDDEIDNKKCEKVQKTLDINPANFYPSNFKTSSNTLKDIRRAIKQLENLISQETNAEKKTAYTSQLATLEQFKSYVLKVTEQEAVGKESEGDKKSRRYAKCKELLDKDGKMLPDDSTLNAYSSYNNPVDKLEAYIKDEEAKCVCDYYEPSEESKDEDYKALKSAFAEMKTAQKKLDDAEKDGDSEDGETPQYHTGGITLADDCGLYKIEMSASNRDITIESPVGTVNINAFTGISISAPNGDVSISGKNVSIEAGNNLTLSAGGNIKNLAKFKKSLKKDNAGLTVANAVTDLAVQVGKDFMPLVPCGASKAIPKKPVDMDTLRCAVECFSRPLEGTLQIHSENNVMLESGGKETTPVKSNLASKANQMQIRRNRNSAVAAAVNVINSTFDDIWTTVNTVNSAKATTKTALAKFLNGGQEPGTDASGYTGDVKPEILKFVDQIKGTSDDKIQSVINTIEGKATAASNPKTQYAIEDITEKVDSLDLAVALGIAKLNVLNRTENAGGAFVYKDCDNNLYTCAEVKKNKDCIAKLEALAKLVEAYAKACASDPTALKDKVKSIKSNNYWWLGDNYKWYVSNPLWSFLGISDDYKIGFTQADMDAIAAYVDQFVITDKVYVPTDTGNKEITKQVLLDEKRKYLWKIAKSMIGGHDVEKDTIFGTQNKPMAVYEDSVSAIPANVPAAEDWDGSIDKFEMYETDDSKLSEYFNHVLGDAAKFLGLNNITDAVDGVRGIFNECLSLSVEHHGNIYLTSKDSENTVRLNGEQMNTVEEDSSELKDIKTALKKQI